MKLARYSIILSIISLIFGGILLLGKVPIILSIGTFSIVSLLLVLLILLNKFTITKYILLFLALLAIIASSVSTAHLNALEEIGSSEYITVLDILMILGFYVGPILYILSFIRENLKRRRY